MEAVTIKDSTNLGMKYEASFPIFIFINKKAKQAT